MRSAISASPAPPDEQVKQAIGSADGFALVLAGAKAWLEQGLSLGLIGDRYPNGVPGR
ncbi:hypothetical protein X770_20410 [Mesorhizobium sp. LSJC269B00]|nr:hypothetical protein X770_20410 [Mesorhizobium sp. LSJC269B00]